MTRPTFIAHCTDDNRFQSVHDHLWAVKNLCETYAEPLHLSHVAGLAGWLHDAGKYAQTFQDYINKSHDGDPNTHPGQVNHAFAGARLLGAFLNQNFDDDAIYLSELIENVVMAHHNAGGPYDYVTPTSGESPFLQRQSQKIKDWTISEIKQHFFEDFSQASFEAYLDEAIHEISLIPPEQQESQENFYLRYIASCLIDADHLETGDFMVGKTTQQKSPSASLDTLCRINEEKAAVQAKQNATDTTSGQGMINRLRGEMSQYCLAAGQADQGIYSLSVPTGGGKTLAGLRFALNQCVTHHLDRIVIVSPYTTIIEQNTRAIRQRLDIDPSDRSTVLEYHSAIGDDQVEQDDPKNDRYYYTRDTWDAPIIMTTQVAYLNALYGRGSKNLRHMHRMINSVVIFDEIQSMPTKTVEMNNVAMNWLAHEGKSTLLLCTATQPALSHDVLPIGIDAPKEIIPDIPSVETAFKRTELVDHTAKMWELDDLMNGLKSELTRVSSVLAVMNTKKAARQAFQQFNELNLDVKGYHLSTAMCAAHRKKVIKAIRENLKNQVPLVVFSTQLIEAGVDLSFGSVFRSLAGIDSVIQAAGRCNRNHETKIGRVHLMRLDSEIENISHGLNDISAGAHITKTLLNLYPHVDPLSAKIVSQYFQRYYQDRGAQLNYPETIDHQRLSLLSLIYGQNAESDPLINKHGVDAYEQKHGHRVYSDLLHVSAPQSVTRLFDPINSNTIPILVQWGQGKEIVGKILSGQTPLEEHYRLLKQAQQYVVQVFGDQRTSENLVKNGVARFDEHTGLWIARESQYDEDFGLDTTDKAMNYFV